MHTRAMSDAIRAATLLVVSCLSTPAAADRDDQWIFRQTLGSGSDKPTAIFLSWEYSAVLFRATCDRSTHDIVLEYFGDGAIPLAASDKLGIYGTEAAMLDTQLINGVLEGRVSADLFLAISGVAELEIDAPNEMGEPWYVGRAEPLRRLARLCQKS
jgi:hypothetical protein